MSTIQEINSTIISGQFTNEQLDSIQMAIKFARNQLATKAKFTLVKGSQVKFTSSKSGQTILGTVEKVNRKTVKVRDNATSLLWAVSPSFLTLVS